MSVRPIFIFSAPRSGSTLVQRILGAHSRIATTSEPWLLLPLLSPLYDRMPASGARDAMVHEALADFVAELPRGRSDYREAIRACAEQLYTRAGGDGVAYFVDKTPLYHQIIDEIVETFPDGKFVFLFRNPLSVVASCVELFDGGRWEAPRYHMALFQSVADLVPASVRHGSRALTVRFEDLVGGDEAAWRAVFSYLELDWEPEVLSRFSQVELHGRLGDRIGSAGYGGLSREPLDKWRNTLRGPVRRAWCRRYLRWIGAERLRCMGYELSDLERALSEAPASSPDTADDLLRVTVSVARDLARARVPRFTSRASTWRALARQ